MNRVAARGFLAGLLIALVGCAGDSSTGPVAVKWDRDPCHRCGMVLSDKRFAAEVRDPGHRAIKFDDFGCAVVWLAAQPWGADPAVEFWVADSRDGRWLEARHARYVDGRTTPMGYGYGAAAENLPGSVDFAAARLAILAKGK